MGCLEGFSVKGSNQKDIYLYYWSTPSKPKAVIQIFHGMAEHAGRYERFAHYMNDKDFAVYANDLRGHGKTAERLGEIGYIGEDGFNGIVEDQHIITETIKANHPNTPVVILAHSFGSFITQEYITRYGKDVSAVIMSGSSMIKGFQVIAGRILAIISKMIFSERKKSHLINKLSFGAYNRKIENPTSPFDWISRDKTEVRKYDLDPYCGIVLSINFYYYFFKGLAALYRDKKLNNIPKSLPIFMISGDNDPVSNYGKGVTKLYENYKRIGLQNVDIKLYEGARHEILNEINRVEVFEDIILFIKDVARGGFY